MRQTQHAPVSVSVYLQVKGRVNGDWLRDNGCGHFQGSSAGFKKRIIFGTRAGHSSSKLLKAYSSWKDVFHTRTTESATQGMDGFGSTWLNIARGTATTASLSFKFHSAK
jgi:hypothetical protein